MGHQDITDFQAPNSAYVIENDLREQDKVLKQILAEGMAWQILVARELC